jgi:hypothetical protein
VVSRHIHQPLSCAMVWWLNELLISRNGLPNFTRLTQWPASCPNAYANLWARALMIHLFLGNVPWQPKMKLAHIIMICNWPSTDDATEIRYSGQRQWHRLTLWPASHDACWHRVLPQPLEIVAAAHEQVRVQQQNHVVFDQGHG